MFVGNAFANLVHMLAAIVWVGGMFFAYVALRPASGALEPPARLGLWARTFANFFPWVWASIVILLASGFWMILVDFGGFAMTGVHVDIMLALGLVMMALFLHLYFAPYRRFQVAVMAGDVAGGAAQLGQIRRIIAINIVLGVITAILGNTGWAWS